MSMRETFSIMWGMLLWRVGLVRLKDYGDYAAGVPEMVYQRNKQLLREVSSLQAQCEALQNRCANRGLSPADSDALQAENKQLLVELGKTRDQAIAEGRIVHKCNNRIAELESLLKEALEDMTCGYAEGTQFERECFHCRIQSALREKDDGSKKA